MISSVKGMSIIHRLALNGKTLAVNPLLTFHSQNGFSEE